MGSLYLLVILIVFLLIAFLITQYFNARINLLKQKISVIDDKLNEAMKLIERNRLLIEDNKENILAQKKARKDEE
ncbi:MULTISPECIES: hypothetical protein [unclassified Campylobacter]|uniref:hypothetical protein n=1 Tax=unclassified Campylobacter TaxID=2593542 RepID=UPI001BDA1FA4|nr:MULTISPECIES: hypothetical protein [unclassified Campylobacter]MBZ7976869.1 hypothetical protein [Campylobacter sp. RM12637]MBZ7978808.1 hypothetical protein [Campylobacter sp. RM12654]MBZ7980538.1 hypothetical protein [Campylobacter sp. RM12642]MBZ7982346.1 hypothetical protein [Campylobacter sp. RM12640]MBZ7984117.1 hypothetical protein [Campylobacter sp. RM12647]MBZ7989725.1 hypothetical protein [Campylobacter sp. RM12635]MBZ7991521.1 hypothetical protein [Campylobacter sp. RM9331]MBZ